MNRLTRRPRLTASAVILAITACVAPLHASETGETKPGALSDSPDSPEWITLGSATLSALETLVVELPRVADGVVGFEIGFNYSEPIADDSWASDLQVIVEGPNDVTYIVGGLTNLPVADESWSFEGEGSDGPGRYGDDGKDIFAPWEDGPIVEGDWTVTLINDWSTDPNPNTYSAQIRFYVVDEGPVCTGDIDESGVVDFGDIIPLLGSWGPCGGCPADLDGSGIVDFGDVVVVLANWGPCLE